MINLKEIELYYSPDSFSGNTLFLRDKTELDHIRKVMRHQPGDELFITDGRGRIFKTVIGTLSDKALQTQVIQEYQYQNKSKNIIFCIPRLRSADRFETALEKCTELGITRFMIFNSERTIPKGDKIDRWEKILVSAMKQSLRSWLPEIVAGCSLEEIAAGDGKKVFFDQKSEIEFTKEVLRRDEITYFIFGPEGDFSETEKKLFNNSDFYSLGYNRLRSETAIIKCASLIS